MQQRFHDSPLLAGREHLDRAAVVGAGRTWTWHQVHEASIALAGELRGASAVCNLCSSRLGFLITLLAALRNRSLMVLPASGSDATSPRCSMRRPAAVVVGDAEQASTPPARALSARRLRRLRPPWKASARQRPRARLEPAWDDVAVAAPHLGHAPARRKPQPKTLRHLAIGALLLGARLTRSRRRSRRASSASSAACRRSTCSASSAR
jgi:hypothetical protein